MAEYNSLPLVCAAEQFAKLPGIGMKTAQKLAYFMLNQPVEEVELFASEIVKARKGVHCCKYCQNLCGEEICSICSDDKRDKKTICVVEAPKDVSALERAGGFGGVYHVLHGLLSPIDNIGPDDIKIPELMHRLAGDVDEVIMATNPTVEGEATATFISRMIKPLGIKVTRLAYGLPAGSSLEFADEITLQRAIENRNVI